MNLQTSSCLKARNGKVSALFFLFDMKFRLLCGIMVCATLFTSCAVIEKIRENLYLQEGNDAVDKLMRDLRNEPSYSIVLHDMRIDESKNLYEHKYKIFRDIEKDSIGKVTKWISVSELFFAENMDYMGLEIASKSADGKVYKMERRH
jgi:hypothetical protein